MATKKLNLNDKFNKIYCINLKSRTDKRNKIEEQAKKYNLDINYFDAVAKPDNPMRGCLESHLEILKLAKRDNLDNVLILEDDCVFLRGGELNNLPDLLIISFLVCALDHNSSISFSLFGLTNLVKKND